MDYFTKKRWAFWGAALLGIMSISALTTVWLQQRRPQELANRAAGKRSEPPHERVMKFLQEELQLTETQAAQFAQDQNRHFMQARELRDAIRDLKQELFQELSAPAPDTAKVEKLAETIGATQSKLEKLTFYHFLDLKRLCTPAQQPKLDALFEELLRMLDPRPKLPPPGAGPPPRH